MEIYSYENYEEYLDEVYPEPPKKPWRHIKSDWQRQLRFSISRTIIVPWILFSSSPAH